MEKERLTYEELETKLTEAEQAIKTLSDRGTSEQKLQLLQPIIDTLPYNIAIVNDAGFIIAVNRFWRDFAADNNLYKADYGLGINYFQLCEDAAANGAKEMRLFVKMINELIAGQCKEFQMEQFCHKFDKKRWFITRVVRFETNGEGCIVIIRIDITKRKQAMIKVQESEQRYRQLLDSVTDYIYTVKMENGVVISTTHSPNCLAVTGYTAQEYEADQNLWYKMIYEKDRPALLDQTNRLFAGEIIKPFEHRLIHKNGSVHWVRNTSVSYKDKKGNVISYDGLITDITKHKEADDNLRDSEARYAGILSIAADAIITIDDDYRIILFNRSAEYIFGYSADEAIGQPVDILIPTGLATMHKKHIHNFSILPETSRRMSSRNTIFGRHKNGTNFPAEASISKLNQNDNMTFTVILRDITKRVRAEDRIKQRNYELNFLNKINQAIISTLDLQEMLTMVIKYITQMLNVSATSIALYDKETNELHFTAVFGAGANFVQGKKLPNGTGIVGWVVQNNEPVVSLDVSKDDRFFDDFDNASGFQTSSLICVPLQVKEEIIGAIEIMNKTDGSFKQTDLRLLNLIAPPVATAIANARLYEQAQQEIAYRKNVEDKLLKQKDKLTRSNAELEQFAYVASHDLQEPLRMITSYVTLLKRNYKGKLDPKADKYIGYAVDGATRMKNLINDLLEYSRLNDMVSTFKAVDCNEVVQDVLYNLQVAIEENEAKVTHDILPTVMADSSQLAQVFQNLIGNAIKFNSGEKPHIHISAGIKPLAVNKKKQDEWLFAVRDNGIGIAPEQVKPIFVIFKRLNSRRKYPGNGIGLAICKKVVEQHKGRIWLESQPGQGSTFYFTIPVHQTS